MIKSIISKIAVFCIIAMLFIIYKIYAENISSFATEQLNEPKEEMNNLSDLIEEKLQPHNPGQTEGLKSEAERRYQQDEFQAGINLIVYEHPNILYAQKLFKKLRSLGVNSVAIVFPLFQSDWQADI